MLGACDYHLRGLRQDYTTSLACGHELWTVGVPATFRPDHLRGTTASSLRPLAREDAQYLARRPVPHGSVASIGRASRRSRISGRTACPERAPGQPKINNLHSVPPVS